MTDEQPTDWEARLLAQGIPPERIADARSAARQMAAALDTVTYAPSDPIAPERFLKIIAERDES